MRIFRIERTGSHGLGGVAASALLAATALTAGLCVAPAAARAQAAQGYDIPAGPLATALNRFVEASGVALVYNSALTNGLSSPGLKGGFSTAEALSRLLAGSGLTFRQTGANAFTLEPAPQSAGDAVRLGPVRVQGDGAGPVGAPVPPQAQIGNLPPTYPGGQVARGGQFGILGNRDIMDMPFNQISYTAQLVEDQQVTTLAGVLANNPGVRAPTPSDGVFDNFFIRGFNVTTAAFTFEGLGGLLPAQMISPIFAERIELLSGPSALLNNANPFGYVGGTVNIVPKRAGDTPMTRITGSYYADAQFGVHVDIGRRFGADDAFGLRFNGAYRNGDTAIDHQSERWGTAVGAFDYRGDDVRFSLDFGHQDQRVRAPVLSIGYAGPAGKVMKAPSAGHNPFQPWASDRTKDDWGIARAEIDLSPDVTVYAAGGLVDSINILVSSFQEIEDRAGNLTDFPYYSAYKVRNRSGEAGIRANLETGSVRHQINLAASIQSSHIGGLFVEFDPFASNLYTSALQPGPSLQGLSDDPPTDSKYLQRSVAIVDTLSFLDDTVLLTLGVRQQNIRIVKLDGPTGVTLTRSNRSKTTPSVGLVVKPGKGISLYGNYIEGLSTPNANANVVNAHEIFPPAASKQIEGGVKVDLGTLGVTVSLFEIRKPLGLVTTIAPGLRVFSVDGEQRNRGLEINAFGAITPTLRILGGLAYTRAKLLKTDDGLNDGNTAPGVPKTQVNLTTEWDLPFLPGATLWGRGIYTSSQYLDPENTTYISGRTTFDIGARYNLQVGDAQVTLRATVENVANNSRWASAANSVLSLAAPRRALLSATVGL